MKAIMIMFDSLNRHMLEVYGSAWTKTPNFKRLAEKSVVFDKSFVGSLPCMPARRELHTGRYNFLHRSWGPLEPFDDSMPEILSKNGIYTHLASDHQHYWEDGGCTYHHRYDTWEIIRGQEGDKWKGIVEKPKMPEHLGYCWEQDYINRQYLKSSEDMPIHKLYENGIEFIENNYTSDNWFLQLESFDPHEPFFAADEYNKEFEDDYMGPVFDWPAYKRVTETNEEIEHCRNKYASLLFACDHYLGKILDLMDKYNMWEDTMLIINTDHGFLLGEHNWWAKMKMPMYNELVNTPLFIWDPRSKVKNERRKSLVQTIDLAPTLLKYFDLDIPKDMLGKDLQGVIKNDEKVRDYALIGIHGNHVSITDGKILYMRSPKKNNQPLYEYTLMPTHMRSMFDVKELQNIELEEPFSFTKGVRTMKIKIEENAGIERIGSDPDIMKKSYLLDLEDDSKELDLIEYEKTIKLFSLEMVKIMKENDVPKEQFERLNL